MKPLTPITMVTVALGGLVLAAPAPAAAAATPTYTCQVLGEDGHGKVTGVQDCRASSGAVTAGTSTETAIVRGSLFGDRFTCTAGVVANIPDTVTADGCTSR
jgi:uncharacterized membrane protein